MNIRSWRVYILLLIIGTIILSVIQLRYGLGYLLGGCISLLVYWNTVHFVDNTLRERMPSGTFFHNIINMVLWSGSLILCALFAKRLNIFACAAGLFLIRISLLIEVKIEGGKKERRR